MSTLEVYAVCIQPRQIAHFIGCDPKDTETIETERARFLDFLQEEQRLGVEYDSQLLAWDAYMLERIIFDVVKMFEHLKVEMVDQESNVWMTQINRAFYRMLNSPMYLGNYSEHYAQQ